MEVIALPKKGFYTLPAEKQEDFFDLALEVFAQQPYHQASLSYLLKLAFIPMDTFYQYFDDKFDLYDHLVTTVLSMKQHSLKSQMPSPPDDFYAYFERILQLETTFRLQHPVFHSLLAFASDPRFSPLSQEKIQAIATPHQQTLHRLVVRNQLKGTIAADLDATMIRFYCQLMLNEFHEFVQQRIHTEKKALKEAAFHNDPMPWVADSSRQFMAFFRRGLAIQKCR